MRRRPSPRSPGTDGGIPARPTESVAPSDSVSSGRSPRCSESRLQPHRMQRETSAGCHSRAEPCTTTPPKQAPAEPPCRRPGNGNSSLPVPEGRRRRNRFPDPAAARPSFHLHAAVSPENVRSRPRPGARDKVRRYRPEKNSSCSGILQNRQLFHVADRHHRPCLIEKYSVPAGGSENSTPHFNCSALHIACSRPSIKLKKITLSRILGKIDASSFRVVFCS